MVECHGTFCWLAGRAALEMLGEQGQNNSGLSVGLKSS